MRATVILVSVLVMCLCLSCGRDPDTLRTEMEKQATEIAEKAKDQVQAVPNAQQIKAEIDRLLGAVDQKDLQRLKNACDAVDVQLGTRVLAKYYKAFSLEVEEGPQSVIAYLNAEIDNLPDGDAERTALVGLRKYFEAKGTLTTRDAAVLILLVALEIKFPHGRGTVFVAPLLDLPKSEDGPKEPPKDQTPDPVDQDFR